MTKEQLYDDVYALLEDRFIRGHYLPNEPISDYALSKELQMSRHPIRRAMQTLQQQGYLSADRHQSKLVIGYSEEESCQMYTYILQLVQMALFYERTTIPYTHAELLLQQLKTVATTPTFFDYATKLADMYQLFIQASNNSIYIHSFNYWYKPFIRMLVLQFRLGELAMPFKEVQQLTQLLRLLRDGEYRQAKLYLQCITDEVRYAPVTS